jgi:hypothetical protein
VTLPAVQDFSSNGFDIVYSQLSLLLLQQTVDPCGNIRFQAGVPSTIQIFPRKVFLKAV